MKENLKVQSQRLELDDNSLIICMEMSEKETLQQKKNLVNKLKNAKDDYIEIKLARLAYSFAREEYYNLYEEARKRGVVTG